MFDLSYDPDVIHVLDVTMGDFPVSTGRTWTALGPDIDNEAGLTSFGSFSFGAQAGPSGMGPVAIVTYMAQSVTATSRFKLSTLVRQ